MPVRPEHALDVTSAEMREWVEQALTHIITYNESITDLPMKDVSGLEVLKKNLREPLPQKGQPLDALLSTIFDDMLRKGVQVPSPGYMAYMPIGSIFHATVAEFVTFAINRWTGLYQFAPGFVEMENTVVSWLCEIMGLPKNSGGTLTSGGSMANFSAIVTARHAKLGEDFTKGVLYCSEQAHHSIEKSARLAGFAKRQLRRIATNDIFQIDIDALKDTIAKDKAQGLTPFLIVANAGSTATGAVDDMAALAAIAKQEHCWLHIDAAWAGSLRLTRKGKTVLADTALGDSITIDPHKALYTPFGCGALLVRDPRKLMEAHSFDAAYLPGENEEEALMSPSKLSPELSRGVRGLQVWLPLKMMGIGPFIATLEEKLKLVEWATAELEKIPNIHIAFAPQTAIVGFRLALPGKNKDECNAATKAMLERINAHGKVLLSSVELNGYTVIRIVPFGQRTHAEHVSLAIEYIKEAATSLS